jgi:hypothetical protein
MAALPSCAEHARLLVRAAASGRLMTAPTTRAWGFTTGCRQRPELAERRHLPPGGESRSLGTVRPDERRRKAGARSNHR